MWPRDLRVILATAIQFVDPSSRLTENMCTTTHRGNDSPFQHQIRSHKINWFWTD